MPPPGMISTKRRPQLGRRERAYHPRGKNFQREDHLWYNCRALAVTAIAVHRTIATAIDRRLDYG